MSELANTVFCQTCGSETNYRCLTIDVDHTLVHIWHTSIKRPPLLSGHLAIPRGWPLNRGSTVFMIILQNLITTNHGKNGESKNDRKLTEVDIVTT